MASNQASAAQMGQSAITDIAKQMWEEQKERKRQELAALSSQSDIAGASANREQQMLAQLLQGYQTVLK